MDKKTRKAIKDLSKTVTAARKRDAELFESWAGRIVEALESQAESNREVVRALESRSGTQTPEPREENDESPAQSQETAPSDEHEDAEEHEVTDAAERRAKDLGVDLDEVEGTGSGGRVLVRDVEEAGN